MFHISDMDVLSARSLGREVGRNGGSMRARTRGGEERNCSVVRQTKKVPGLWLTVKEAEGRKGGVGGRRRMVVVGQMPLNASLGPVEGGREGGMGGGTGGVSDPLSGTEGKSNHSALR